MKTRGLAEYLSGHPFFAGLDADAIGELAGCARNVHVSRGEYLFRAGTPADHFYVVTHGRIGLELHSPGSGSHVLDSAGEGEVLDWPWLIPPHEWFFDARAAEPATVLCLDSACLRRKLDEDPGLGYQVIQRVAQVMSHRLQATRVRLLDLYGPPGARPAGTVPAGGDTP